MAGPTLTSTIEAVQDGSIFKESTQALDSLTKIATSLPETASKLVSGTVSAVTSAVGSAISGTASAITVAASFAGLEKLTSQQGGKGDPLGEAVCKAFDLFDALPKTMDEAVNMAIDKIIEVGKSTGIGQVIGSAFEQATHIAKEINKMANNAMKMVGDAFDAAMKVVTDVQQAVSDAVSSAMDAVNNLISDAVGAIYDQLDKLASYADSLVLSLPLNTPCLSCVKDKVLNKAKTAVSSEVVKAHDLIKLPAIEDVWT